MSAKYEALKLPAVMRLYPKSRSSVYQAVSDGLFPRPFRIGKRSVAWYRHEVDAIVAAHASGREEKSIRMLVDRLEAERLQFAKDLAN